MSGGSLIVPSPDVNAPWYSVRSIDNLGNASARSTSVMAVDEDPPPATPTGLTAEAGDGEVALSWNPVTDADLAGYTLEIAESATGPWTTAADNLTTTTTTIDDLTNGTTYHFRVRAVDTTGLASAPSTLVNATPDDTTAPAAPTGLTATAGDSEVALSWNAVTDADLAGYTVEVAESAAGPWTTAAESLAGTATTIDGLTNGTTFHFRVRAVDTSANTSAPSGPVSATPDETTPPETPYFLYAMPGFGQVGLSWVQPDYTDVTGYQVYRASSADGPFVPAGDPVNADESYVQTVVTGLAAGVELWLAVTAIDEHGNESAHSVPVSTVPFVLEPPRTLDVGSRHTCQVLTGGALSCWGNNYDGQFDEATPEPQSPERIGTDTDWASVAAGDQHTCALKTDGTAWCWGRNWYGQLGNGTLDNSTTPVRVDTDDRYVSIFTGDYHTCALRADATAWCWGAGWLRERR